MNLQADTARAGLALVQPSEILVRATKDGVRQNVDLVELDLRSLIAWLRSGGGHNPLAEAVVAGLLGHEVSEATIEEFGHPESQDAAPALSFETPGVDVDVSKMTFPCTGPAASWCPRCGLCSCKIAATVADDCPLHGHASLHGKGEYR